MQQRQGSERGFAHAALIIGVLLFLGVIAFIAWRVISTQQSGNTDQTQTSTDAPCESNDAELCAFFSAWDAHDSYRVVSTQTSEGSTTTSTYEVADNGSRFWIKTESNGIPYETITIGDTLYTKSNSDGTWYRQTNDASETENLKDEYEFDFKESTEDETAEPIEYKRIGTEACGDLTCYKYQIIDPSVSDVTQYLWFDTTEHHLRRMLVETPDSTNNQEFSYDNIVIDEPSPVEELGPNQTIDPTTGEIITLPAGQ